MFNNFFLPNIVPFFWDNVDKFGRVRQTTDDNMIGRMRNACWITKATNALSEYVIFFAFPLQQWLRERASVLRYTCIACLCLWFLLFYRKYELNRMSGRGRGLLWRKLPTSQKAGAAERLTSNVTSVITKQCATWLRTQAHYNQDVYTLNYWKTYASCSCSLVSVFMEEKC